MHAHYTIGVAGFPTDVVQGRIFQDAALAASRYVGQNVKIIRLTPDRAGECDGILFSAELEWQADLGLPAMPLRISGLDTGDKYDLALAAITKLCEKVLLGHLPRPRG